MPSFSASNTTSWSAIPYMHGEAKGLNRLYRARYPSCHGKYSLSVPLWKRFFDLAIKGNGAPHIRRASSGKITSNFVRSARCGTKLIEDSSPTWGRNECDTLECLYSRHGTPTVILLAKKQLPIHKTIRAVALGTRGANYSLLRRKVGLDINLQQIDNQEVRAVGRCSECLARNSILTH